VSGQGSVERRRGHKAHPSARERRTYDQIARLRAKAKRRAIDWQHRTTIEFADTFVVINIGNAAGPVVSGRGDLGVARSAKRQPPRAA
jgi:hypothetical protein